MDLRKLLSFFFALTLFYNLYAQSATGVDLSKKFKNYQIVQRRYLNIFEKTVAVIINYIIEKNNKNYR